MSRCHEIRNISLHCIASCPKNEECPSADQGESSRPPVDYGPEVSFISLRCTDDTQSSNSIDDGIYLPMGAYTKHDSSHIPTTVKRGVQREEDEERQNGLGRTAR